MTILISFFISVGHSAPFVRNGNLKQARRIVDNCLQQRNILLYYIITLVRVSLLNWGLEECHCILERNHLADTKKGNHADHVDAPGKTKSSGQSLCIHDVKLNIPQSNLTQNSWWNELFQSFDTFCWVRNSSNTSVQEEDSTTSQLFDDIKLVSLDVWLIMTCNIFGLTFFDAERCCNGELWRKSQMRDCITRRLLGIVLKVRLYRHLRMIVANHFDSFLVCSNRAIRSEPPENTLCHLVFGQDDQLLPER